MPELAFFYKRRVGLTIAGILVFVGCVFIIFYLGLHEFPGLRSDDFGAAAVGTAFFFWMLAAFMAGLAILCTIGLFKTNGMTLSVTLKKEAMIAPQGPLSSKIVTIPYSDISKLKIAHFRGGNVLYVFYQGRHIGIVEGCLPEKGAFETIYKELQNRSGKAV